MNSTSFEEKVTLDDLMRTGYAKLSDSDYVTSIEFRGKIVFDLNEFGEIIGIELIDFDNPRRWRR